MTWQQEQFTKFTSTEFIPLQTVLSKFTALHQQNVCHLIKMRKQGVSLLTCATSTDDARGRYWKKKANRGEKMCP
jgi:hypothetical protein